MTSSLVWFELKSREQIICVAVDHGTDVAGMNYRTQKVKSCIEVQRSKNLSRFEGSNDSKTEIENKSSLL